MLTIFNPHLVSCAEFILKFWLHPCYTNQFIVTALTCHCCNAQQYTCFLGTLGVVYNKLSLLLTKSEAAPLL